ncbi:MAG: pilin [Selenomonas sp.]|nr:pilin [Selenomonas sp.]
MLQRINNFFRKSQIGQGIVEYALILAFVVAVAVVLGNNGGIRNAVSNIFNKTQTQLNTEAQAGG